MSTPWGVVALVELGVDLQPGAGGRLGDRVDDDLVADQRPAAPVFGDEAPQAMLDLVPLAGGGREVADRYLKAAVVGEALQLGLPQAEAVAVAAAAVCGDLQGRGVRVGGLAQLLPPTADRRDRERGGLLGDPDVDEAVVGADVIDAVWDRFAERLVGEVMDADGDRLALGAPLASAVCVLADELFSSWCRC